ncbi:hypothetical protein EPN44_05065 [bacterium]|nr:MAG: hypothetical protein EPN44_05065 [bacterium]
MLRNAGLSLRKIADHRPQRGHNTRRGKKWNATQVRRLLALIPDE